MRSSNHSSNVQMRTSQGNRTVTRETKRVTQRNENEQREFPDKRYYSLFNSFCYCVCIFASLLLLLLLLLLHRVEGIYIIEISIRQNISQQHTFNSLTDQIPTTIGAAAYKLKCSNVYVLYIQSVQFGKMFSIKSVRQQFSHQYFKFVSIAINNPIFYSFSFNARTKNPKINFHRLCLHFCS